MEDEGINAEMDAEPDYRKDNGKKNKKKAESQALKKQHEMFPQTVSPQCSSSSYTTADEDQGHWLPIDTSVSGLSHNELLAQNKQLRKLYEDKCKVADALKHELACVRDTSCVDASMGQLSSGVEGGPTDPMIYETLKKYQVGLLERDEMINKLASALEEKNKNDDLQEREKENLLQKVMQYQQQLSEITTSVQSQQSASSQVFRALQDENELLKQELQHKDLLYQEASTKQFSLETYVQELEERNRQQEAELRSAIALARRAQINEDSKQVECLLKNIGVNKHEVEEESTDIHLWKEAMAAEEQVHHLFVKTLESQHQDEIVHKELSLRLELSEKVRELEEKHFEEISAMSKQLGEKLQELKDEVKETILLQLSVGIAGYNVQDQGEGVPSLEKILLGLDGEKEELKEKVEFQIKSLIKNQVELRARILEEQHDLNLRRQLANQDLVQQQELATLRTCLERERQLQVTHLHQELSKRHKEEINKVIQNMKSEKDRLKSYVTTGGYAMTLLKKQYCMEYKAAFQGLVSSWYGQWKQEMSSLSAKFDSLSDSPQINPESDLESLPLMGLDDADSLLGEQERLLSEAKDIGQRLVQHLKSSLGDIMKALEGEHSRVVERIEKMRSELEEAGIAARLQVLVDRLRTEKLDLQNRHKLALDNMSARHDSEVVRLRRLVQEVQALGESDALKAQQLELERRHQKEMEDLRSYFEEKCAEVGKNYSEEVYSQHSRKMSGSNSSSECELGSEIYYTGPGPGPVMGGLGGSSGAGDGPRQVQHVFESCLDSNYKEKLEKLRKDFGEKFETQRLALESRYQGEIETLKEEYETRVKELVRGTMESHNNEISSMKVKFDEEKDGFLLEIKTLQEKHRGEESKTIRLEKEIALLRQQRDKLQEDVEAALKEVESLSEELDLLRDVPSHEVSREIETTTEEWIDSLEIISEPKESAAVKYVKTDFGEKVRREEELEALRKTLQEQKIEIAQLQKSHREDEVDIVSLRNILQEEGVLKAELEKSLQEGRVESAALQKSLQEEKVQIEELRKSLEKEMEERATLRKIVEKEIEERAALRKILEAERVRHEEEIAALQKRIIAVKGLEKKCTELSARVAEFEQKFDFSVTEKKCLDEKCSEMEQINEHFRKECLDWELKYIDLNKENENLKVQLNSVNLQLEKTSRANMVLTTQVRDLESNLKEAEEKLKSAEEKKILLSEELERLQSEKENYLARFQSEVKEKHEAEVARLKKYYEELQSRTAEGQEDSSQPCEQKRLRQELNEALQREKSLTAQCQQWEECVEKKDVRITEFAEALKRKDTEAAHQMAVLKSKLRESYETIDWYDKRGVEPTEHEARTEGCGAPSKAHCPSQSVEMNLRTLLAQIESQYAEHLRLIQKCSKESQMETAVKFVRALEQIHQQHERDMSQLDLPTKQSFSRRGSSCHSNYSGDGDCSKASSVPTLDDLLEEQGALDNFNEESIQLVRKASEQLEAKHQSQLEDLRATSSIQLKKALREKEQEFERMESELRSEQDLQIREIRLDAERRLQLRLDEARQDIVHTLENSVQALLTDDEEVERPPELQKLEEKLAAKYRKELELQKEKHDAEIQKLRQQSDARTQRKGVKNAAMLSERLAVVTSERDCLRTVASTLRDLVFELVRYFVSCEDRMNSTILEELALFGQDMSILRSARRSSDSDEKYEDDGMSSPPHEERGSLVAVPFTPNTSLMKRVRFTENLSGVVKCIDDPSLLQFVRTSPDQASADLQDEIDHCVSQLRSEAEALFALSKKVMSFEETESAHSEGQDEQSPQMIDDKPSELLTSEKESTRERPARRASRPEVFFEEFGDTDLMSSPRSASLSPRGKVLQNLLKKARVQLPDIPQISLFLEELCRDWERQVEEFRREEENLRQQVKTADKQLRETRKFLEEQVAEREQERDEIQRLRDVVREKDRERCSLGNISEEVESLTHQLHDTSENLKEAEKKNKLLEEERDFLLDKIRILQENMNDLEGQILKKMQEEATLGMRISMLQKLTEEQGKTHLELAQECENLRNDSLMVEEVRALQEKLQQYEIFVREGNHLQTMLDMRSQLGDIEVLVECRTKLLENASAAAPGSPALSSPSEDVSVRETIEVMRSILREENEKKEADKLPSLPVDAVARLDDRMQRHVRAEEALLKKIRDLDMQLNSMRTNLTEIQAERDILSDRLQEKLLQSAQLEARVDELRRKNDASQLQAVHSIKGQLSEAQSEIAILREDLENRKRQCDDLQRTLERTQTSLQKKEREVNQIAESHQYLIEQLKSQIAKNLKEKEKLKELYSNKVDSSTALPLLVNSMLDDKNADIDMLKIQVDQLTKQMAMQKRDKRDQRCSPIPCEIISSTQLHSFQKSGVRCEYSVSPGSSIEYREGEKLRASDKLARNFILEKSIDLTQVESPESKKLCGVAEEQSNVDLSLPLFTQQPPLPVQASTLDIPLVVIPENDSMGSSIGQEETHQGDGEPSISRSDRDDTLQSMVDELRTTVSNLTNDNNSLKDELSNKESEIKRLTEQVISCQNILASLQTKLEEARRMAEYSAASSDLVQENNDLKERCVSLRAELEENFKERESELRRLLEAEQSAARAAHQELEAVRCDVDGVKEKFKTVEEEKILLKSELEKVKHRVDTGGTKMLSEKLESEKEFSKALKEELNMCRVRISDLEKEVKKLEEERVEKVSEAVKRIEELKNCQERLEFLLGENAKLDGELSALKVQQKIDIEEQNRSEYLVQEITHLRTENSEIGRELTELKKNMNKMRMDEASRANQEHKELRHLLRDNSKLKKELSSLRRAIESVYGGENGAHSPEGSVGGLSNEDKALILSLRNKMDCLSEKLDTPKRDNWPQKTSRLTRSELWMNEYCPPGSPLRESESLEDLTGLVRRELDVSAHLDDTLLQSLHPLGNKEKHSQPSSSQVKDSTGRLPPSSDSKSNQLTEVLQQLKNSNMKISTELTETRCAVRLLQNQLEIERGRYKTLQEQDSNLIEAMRIKLEQALDSEAQMRTLLETEQIQRQKILHQMPSGGGDNLVRSPRLIADNYHEAETCRADVQRQMKVLENQLARAVEELEQRRMAQDVLVKKAQALELRRSRKRAADEEQHRKKFDVANLRLEELQKELEVTRRQLRSVSQDLHESRQLEAALRKELSDIRCSQLQDHRHILQELENIKKHDSEKICLADQIKNLMEERNQLQERISQLEGELASRKVNDNWTESSRLKAERGCWERERTALHTALTQATQKQCSHDSDLDEKVEYLFGKYLRCESHKKALVWQKRYLLLVVNSYHQSRLNILFDAEISLHCPRPIPSSYFERDCSIRRAKNTSPLRRFRLAVNVIKAIVRMRSLIQRWNRSRRIGSNVLISKNYVQTTSDHASSVGVRRNSAASVAQPAVGTSSAAMAGDGGLVSHQNYERASFSSSRVPVHRNAGPWSTESSLAAYVSRLNVMQQRFDAVLAQTPNS